MDLGNTAAAEAGAAAGAGRGAPMVTSPAARERSDRARVDEYIIGRELGRGSFAKVYLCQHEKTGAQRAIKKIDRSRLSTKLLQVRRHHHICRSCGCHTPASTTITAAVAAAAAALDATNTTGYQPPNNHNHKPAQNLESEISILRDYQHTNIVKLDGIKKTRGHIFLVLEFCAGGDLHK